MAITDYDSDYFNKLVKRRDELQNELDDIQSEIDKLMDTMIFKKESTTV